MVRAVVVVVMRLFLPVQDRVSQSFARTENEAATGRRNSLEEKRDGDEKDKEHVTHGPGA